MSNIGEYSKALVGALLVGFTALSVSLEDALITSTEWIEIAAAFFIGLGAIWLIPNSTKSTIGRLGKCFTAAIVAGLAALAVGFEDGVLDNGEWPAIIAAMLITFATVWAVPNAQSSDSLVYTEGDPPMDEGIEPPEPTSSLIER